MNVPDSLHEENDKKKTKKIIYSKSCRAKISLGVNNFKLT